MNLKVPEKSPQMEKLKEILQDLKEKGDFIGIILAYREGGCVAENISEEYPNFNSNEFASMCASVLESAIELGKTIGDEKIDKIIAELENQTVLVIECDENTFLTLLLNEKSKVTQILNEIEKYLRKIIFLY